MGYRERRAHKSQQKQQQFSTEQGGSARRVSLPAPKTMNLRDEARNLPPDHAPVIIDAYWNKNGLRMIPQFRNESIISPTSADENSPAALISYHGSGSSSAEMWLLLAGSSANVYNVGEAIDSTASVTASAQSLAVLSRTYDHTIFNKTIIMVAGAQASTQLKWTRASGWGPWSATCSGTSIGVLAGISQFKSRLIGWEVRNTRFWYSSVDQVLGTMNSFELGGIINAPIKTFCTISKDGGAGPDDYAAFISDEGEVALYEGIDPAASTWSLVGVFKIGRPLSHSPYINYGAETVILCEDDFYFLPRDLAGKRNATLGVDSREIDTEGRQTTNAIYDSENGAIIFSDGSLWSIHGNLSYSNITLCSADPWKVRQQVTSYFGSGGSFRPLLAMYKGKPYCYAPYDNTNKPPRINRLFPPPSPAGGSSAPGHRFGGQIRTAPLQTSGRTNISMVNPLFGWLDYASASTSSYAATQLTYRTGLLYDKAWQGQRALSAEQLNIFVTTSASSDTYGLWTPGFGTGDDAQIVIEILSGSADDQELYLHGIDLIIEDTGGI